MCHKKETYYPKRREKETYVLVDAEPLPTLFAFSRVVSQVDYPSLVDLRGLLLDHVAQLLGALSRIRYVS